MGDDAELYVKEGFITPPKHINFDARMNHFLLTEEYLILYGTILREQR